MFAEEQDLRGCGQEPACSGPALDAFMEFCSGAALQGSQGRMNSSLCRLVVFSDGAALFAELWESTEMGFPCALEGRQHPCVTLCTRAQALPVASPGGSLTAKGTAG